MRVLLTAGAVLVVMVVGGSCFESQPDQPMYLTCANHFEEKVQNKFDQQRQFIEEQIDNLNTRVNNIRKFTNSMDTKLTKLVNQPTGGGGGSSGPSFQCTETIVQLNNSVSTMLADMAKNMEAQIRATVEELLATHIGQLQQTLLAAINTPRSDADLSEVLTKVQEVKDDVAKVAGDTTATKAAVDQCNQQNTAQELQNVLTKVSEVKTEVESLGTGLDSDLQIFKDVMIEVFNNTQPPPPPTPYTPIEPGTEQVPCDDSMFLGANSINVCNSAVRFDKCNLEPVSFHCCHTCTAEGKLPEDGPWRYRNETRTVSTLEVIRFFAL